VYQGPLGDVFHGKKYFFAWKDDLLVGTYRTMRCYGIFCMGRATKDTTAAGRNPTAMSARRNPKVAALAIALCKVTWIRRASNRQRRTSVFILVDAYRAKSTEETLKQ
jgi:hypothetical protein